MSGTQAGEPRTLLEAVRYFSDPDGHPWEIAHNPFFPIGPDGRVHIP